jgi:signal transduction histidine kinase
MDVGAWARRVAGLDARMTVAVVEGPALTIQADGDQLDQLLINLARNAIDAALETGGQVAVGWEVAEGRLHLWVDDNGPGVAEPEQAFVPFYTTKPEGAGIGLPLSRQIAENHGGTLALEPPPQGRGCRASLWLPLNGSA